MNFILKQKYDIKPDMFFILSIYEIMVWELFSIHTDYSLVFSPTTQGAYLLYSKCIYLHVLRTCARQNH